MQMIMTVDRETGATALAERLIAELSTGSSVLWLVSGGSNIQASVGIMKQLPENLTPKLSVMLGDERYGAPGHRDSNWAQLLSAGFDGKQARLLPVLQADLTFDAARDYYEQLATDAFANNDKVIAQLGIGSDGHIAGILPRTEAVQAQGLVAAYNHDPYQRLTLTFEGLQHVMADYSFAFGDDKREAIQALATSQLTLDEQPSQILKQLPEAYLYSDQLGEMA